ncbi:MAG: bifunctional phosphoribosylaminoimidazolecarboxamide formyltransferase/IMP cyclohydrolase [Endozoicomonadaceae bacterium]|nr:bifunctional phosphoribosylaminoimidazolecarboxamide formyltransferase/IMP cyclohydrolase [Endozoicomonadaceae bacterium]
MTHQDAIQINRTLISVSDKNGLTEFAEYLIAQDIHILSTGGTQTFLHDQHIETISVSHYTQYPEIMGGRVKSLHPKIYGGILARRGQDDDIMAQENIQPIDLVIVNLYPFSNTIQATDCTLPQAIEQIDIGGPSMIRAAAKNYQYVAVITDPDDYPMILEELKKNKGTLSLETRYQLALKAFAHTAEYDTVIAKYFTQQIKEQVPQIENPLFYKHHTLDLTLKNTLRYGENPHQSAAFYTVCNQNETGIAKAKIYQGKQLSYNNFLDCDAALKLISCFDAPACVIIKHGNPCGTAIGDNLLQAYQLAFSSDTTSAFGGIIAFNQIVTASIVEAILSQQFVELVMAPKMTDEALACFSKKTNIRVLTLDLIPHETQASLEYHSITGGLLVQTANKYQLVDYKNLRQVTTRAPNTQEKKDLLFAWKVVQHVKSNAIVYAKNKRTIGIGAGQMSRIMSAHIAALKSQNAKQSLNQAVMASDAFFPFRDAIDEAAKLGITAIIQPGGSIRDDEIIQACNQHNIAMLCTHVRHFLH